MTDAAELVKLADELEHYAHRAMPHYPNDICSRARRAMLAIAAQQDGAWQSIETAPKDGSEVLVSDCGLVRVGFWDQARGGVWSKWPGRENIKPTHWQPLPAPPPV